MTGAPAHPAITTLADFWQHIDPAHGEGLALRKRLLSLQLRTAAVERQRVALLTGLTPLLGAGWWLPELAELTGGDLVLAAKGAPPPAITVDALLEARPDVLVMACRGQTLDANRQAWRTLAAEGAVKRLQAVRHGRVFAVDGVEHFNSSGPALIASAEILAELLHRDPGLTFGHEGRHWMRVA